ncbi:hypothetical protein [Aneurinibacillus migulanus]|uniref:hypothetical protein n=1 Tax=Aneurinibacillus migulanus TaxID=47500 RepID=UPI0020A230EA|nr:hypothetical protein [Aneurinibacillus migulanus]MCP1355516.1 hypothetical protein [Aneurinibacillus migulanus]
MKMHVVYISRLMKAGEVREACTVTKLMPDRYLIDTVPEEKKKAAERGNAQTA